MTNDEIERIAADEAALENRYAAEVKQRDTQRLANQQSITRNTFTQQPADETRFKTELVGRVALESPNHDYLDGAKDFYIGTTHHNGDDYQVFSWAAPVSCTFFGASENHHPLCNEVAGLRILSHSGGVIRDIEDVFLIEEPEGNLFPKRRLQIPKPPTTDTQNLSGSRDGEQHESESANDSPAIKPQNVANATSSKEVDSDSGSSVRAPSLLKRELAKPKSRAMTSVLSTLQPDQFDAIVRPAAESQFLQGHPGTGKTIIAVHRLAYLVNPHAPTEHSPKRGHPVLLLGPTEEYVQHVRGALTELVDDPSRYTVQSISSMLDDLADLPPSSTPTESVILQNVDQELARLVDDAIGVTKANLGAGESPNSEDVYQQLIWFTEDPPERGLHKDWYLYLKQLPPSLKELRARKSRQHRGLLAYLKVRTEWPPDPGHVIVDEAQDIHPIEWEVLGRIGNLGGWTILGDLNQRRTDHTFSSWDDVARLLAIEDENDQAPVRVLENGYRSTKQIMRFANQLLPAHSRTLRSLQHEGDEPRVVRAASEKTLPGLAIREALELTEKSPKGTVAIITVVPEDIEKSLRREGWSPVRNSPSLWEKEALQLSVLVPQRARGLEFDGVVVVEPSMFPENFGRQGVLYTALTRANKSLTVAHCRAMPRELKRQNKT